MSLLLAGIPPYQWWLRREVVVLRLLRGTDVSMPSVNLLPHILDLVGIDITSDAIDIT